ncbi:MAG TPA: nucleoside deaminase [Candidatus Cloacimonadota bacterium]|nr:nucleoside deaminase [Candidatus Cloacimonadota bacterium]
MTHEYFMNLALLEAEKAVLANEIPVGACLVKDGELIILEHNRTRELRNPLAHAEKLILDTMLARGEKYFYDYTLYITLEPCLMCAGMLIWARMGTVVYGAADPKAGAAGSIYNVFRDKSFNHHPKLISGILAEPCAMVLTNYFRKKR